MLRNTRYSEWLLPYLEGGLDEARRAQLEARLAVDPALADEARRLARTVGGLRGVASRMPRPDNASVPADLWPHLRARLVLDPAPSRPRARAWWLAGVGAPAAAALIVAAFWLPGWHTLPQPTLAPKQTAALRPVTTPKAAAPAPAISAASKSAPSPRVVTAPAPSVMPVQVAKAGAAKPGVTALNAAPAAPPASPFDLPTPAPPVARAANRVSKPQAVPAPPGAGAAQSVRPPAVLPAPPTTAPAPPAPLKPVPAAPVRDRAAPSPDTSAPAMTAGAAEAAAGLVPKGIKSGPAGDVSRRAKAQSNAAHFAPPPVPPDAPEASALGPQGGLDSWQADLSAAVRSPLWGENEGDAQATQALMAAREAGQLDDLRARLEARRAQSPRDVVTGRMLAAVYDFGFSKEAALRERRRVAGLEGAVGEDWYALAQAEEHAGGGAAARAAYRRALESAVPPSPFHAAIARGKA